MPQSELSYRDRIYAKYASGVMGQVQAVSPAVADAWGRTYDHYLRGWLPADRQAVIVDLGCGYGRLLRFFATRGYMNVQGVDLSPEQVKLARALHSNVVQGDVLEYLAHNTGQIDLLTGIDIVEHFTKGEVLQFLELCHSALKPGGRLILQTPNAESPWGMTRRYGDFTHEECFSPHLLGRLLRMSGFSDYEPRECGPRGWRLTRLIRRLAWGCIRLNLRIWNMAETGSPGSGVFTRVFIASAVRVK